MREIWVRISWKTQAKCAQQTLKNKRLFQTVPIFLKLFLFFWHRIPFPSAPVRLQLYPIYPIMLLFLPYQCQEASSSLQKSSSSSLAPEGARGIIEAFVRVRSYWSYRHWVLFTWYFALLSFSLSFWQRRELRLFFFFFFSLRYRHIALCYMPEERYCRGSYHLQEFWLFPF